MNDPAGLPSELALVVGERFELALPSLGTAGYRWESTLTGDPDVVTLDWRRGAPAGSAVRPPIGAATDELLGLTATAPGRVVLGLAQRRPWEKLAPRAEHTVSIEVRPIPVRA